MVRCPRTGGSYFFRNFDAHPLFAFKSVTGDAAGVENIGLICEQISKVAPHASFVTTSGDPQIQHLRGAPVRADAADSATLLGPFEQCRNRIEDTRDKFRKTLPAKRNLS